MSEEILVVGGGLAGSEAAWQLAEAGINVCLVEMRPERTTPAHQGDQIGHRLGQLGVAGGDEEHRDPSLEGPEGDILVGRMGPGAARSQGGGGHGEEMPNP